MCQHELVSTYDNKKVSSSKLDWATQKEEEAKKRKVLNKIKKTEEQIENTEEKIKQLESKLFDENVSSDAYLASQIFLEKQNLETNLELLFETWEQLQE